MRNIWTVFKTDIRTLSKCFFACVVVVSIALCWLVAAVTAISGIKYLWDNRSFINTAK